MCRWYTMMHLVINLYQNHSQKWIFDETFAVPHYFILRLFVISTLISSATSPMLKK